MVIEATSEARAAQGPYSILMYCGDILGLGHLRRNTAIASEMVRRFPGSNVLLLTSLPTGNFFDCPEGVDFVKLPSLGKDSNGRVVARNLDLTREKFLRLRSSVIDSVARNFLPDLLLVDHLPAGVEGELLPTLQALRGMDDPPRLVLGLRDIVDDPEVTKRRWQRDGLYRTIEELYDVVLVYGSREVFDAAFHYGLNSKRVPEVIHCGYICAEKAVVAPGPTRHDLGLGDGKLIVITAGGGADGYPMMKLCLDALRNLGAPPDCEVVCITGPFMSREQLNDLRARCSGLPVRVLWCVEWTPGYFGFADLIVAMSGYNTLMEAIRLGKKVLVLPRTGPSAEQTIRTDLFSRLGVVRGVSVEERTPQAIARVMRESLEADAPPGTLPEMDGLDRVGLELQKLLVGEARSTRRIRTPDQA